MKKVFISMPYSGTLDQMNERVKHAKEYSVILLQRGIVPVCPVTSGHLLVEHSDIELSHQSWLQYAYEFFEMCDEVHVLQLQGWKESLGVAEEVYWARRSNKPVTFIPVHNSIFTH